jgi:large subunit ribosomal protein L10
MPSNYNQQQVATIKDKRDKAKSIFIIDYSGTNANEQVELRAAVREAGGEIFVSKNTLMKIALDNEQLVEALTGMNALVFSYEDVVTALKKIYDFHQEQEKLEIKKGWLAADDKVLDTAALQKLSQLPSKEELIVQLIQQIKGPAYGLANVLQAGQRNLVYALQAISQQKQEAN